MTDAPDITETRELKISRVFDAPASSCSVA